VLPFNPYGLALIAIPVMLSLTLHEFGHARAALAFGDDTAYRMGRCTLNPLAHLDAFGTICFLVGPIGWAKPVPVDPSRLHPYRLGDICVSLAGVGMNLILILVSVLALWIMAAAGVKVNTDGPVQPTTVGIVILFYNMLINLSLLLFNLIPLYPLDGHHVLHHMLPLRMQFGHDAWQMRYGQIILIALIALPWLLTRFDAPVMINPVGKLLRIAQGAAVAILPNSTQWMISDALTALQPYLPW
jgi:Zn-dependent protease